VRKRKRPGHNFLKVIKRAHIHIVLEVYDNPTRCDIVYGRIVSFWNKDNKGNVPESGMKLTLSLPRRSLDSTEWACSELICVTICCANLIEFHSKDVLNCSDI